MLNKGLFPAAGFDTCFLHVAKPMPRELPPIVDKPSSLHVAKDAIAAGSDTLRFVTGRHKCAIEDHFDNNQELEIAL